MKEYVTFTHRHTHIAQIYSNTAMTYYVKIRSCNILYFILFMKQTINVFTLQALHQTISVPRDNTSVNNIKVNGNYNTVSQDYATDCR